MKRCKRLHRWTSYNIVIILARLASVNIPLAGCSCCVRCINIPTNHIPYRDGRLRVKAEEPVAPRRLTKLDVGERKLVSTAW